MMMQKRSPFEERRLRFVELDYMKCSLNIRLPRCTIGQNLEIAPFQWSLAVSHLVGCAMSAEANFAREFRATSSAPCSNW